MRKILAALAAVVATAVTAMPAASSPTIVQAEVCTLFFANSGAGCGPPGGMGSFSNYGYVYNTDTNGNVLWYSSPSYARRSAAGVGIWGDCLPAGARIEVKYVKQNGVQLGSVQSSSYGACYFADQGWSSNGIYVKIMFRLVPSPSCTYCLGRWMAGWSWWY